MSGNNELDKWVKEKTVIRITKLTGMYLIGKIKSISDNGIWITFELQDDEDFIVLTAFSIDSIEEFDGNFYCHD